MKSKPRICACCGANYTYCPHCDADADKPTWMFVWDTFECKKVFNILTQYNSKLITKEEAKEELNKIITGTINFKDSIKKELDELFKEEIIEEEIVEEVKPKMVSKSKAKKNSDGKLNNLGGNESL